MKIPIGNPLKRKGIALITTLVILAVLVCIVVDLAFSTKVTSNIASNMERDLRATYLAESAFTFAKVFLKLDLQISDQIGSQISNLLSGTDVGGLKLGDLDPSTMHIWDIFPISYPPQVELLLGVTTAEGVTPPQSKDEIEGFNVEIEDESTKININGLTDKNGNFDNEKKSPIFVMLLNILEDETMKELFRDESSHKREELIYNLVDWIDKDFEMSDPRRGGDENSLYYKYKDPYVVKNAKFDSMSEILMVDGVLDKFYNAIVNFITVHGDNKINVKAAPIEVITSLLNDTITDKKEKAEQIMNFRIESDINASNFLSKMTKALNYKNPDELFIKELVKNQNEYINTKSTKFKIKATGIVGKINRTIIAVVDRGRDITSEIQVFYRRIF